MTMLALHDGTPFPAFGLGTWLAERDVVYRAVREAIRLGYRHIDCAWIYGNEAEVGRGIAEAISAGEVTREALWVTTKLWNDMHAAADVKVALEASLRLLGLDYVDLYLMHWPVAHRRGVTRPTKGEDFLSLDELPLAQTWGAMAKLPGSGLARQIGVSNFSTLKIDLVHDAVGVMPAVNQVELHPYNAQTQLLAAMAERGVIATGYSPLGSGGRPPSMTGENEVRLLDDPVVAGIAAKRECSSAQVLLAWALGRKTAVIPKSTDPGRLALNLAATAVVLSAEDRAAVDTLDSGTRYVTGSFWCPPGSPYSVASLWA